MKLARFAIDNVRDMRALGVRYPLRLVPRPSRGSNVRVTLKGIGRVTLRKDSSDAQVFSQVFSASQYELMWFPQYAGIEGRYRRIVNDGRRPLIIDAGANNGASALWFATRFPEAKVVAVEPEPTNASLCRENTRGFDVEVLNVAIGSQPGSVALVTEGREMWAVSTIRRNEGSVRICTVSEIIDAHPECELFIVKIDIEGFESDLFASNTDWVADAKVIMIEPHDYLLPDQASSRNFQQVLSRHDFDILISGENLVYIKRDLLERQNREVRDRRRIVVMSHRREYRRPCWHDTNHRGSPTPEGL